MNKIFAERLKELREERNLSMQNLAKELGVSSSSICRWEKCQADAKGDELVILAIYFKVSTDYLLGLSND